MLVSRAAYAFLLLSPLALAFQSAGPIDSKIVRPRVPPVEIDAADAPESKLRVDASLVLIPAQVATEEGAPVTQLDKASFHIFEDGVEQKITHFGKDDAPISIGVLFDSSGSMHNKMKKSLEAAAAFFKTANPQDEFFLIDFNEKPRLAVGFTSDSGEIYRRISHTKPFGRTSLFDAINMGVREMKHAKNARKAIVIVSDGGDNRSRMTFHSVKNLVEEADVQMYSMGIFDPEEFPKLPREEQDGPELLDELTALTGGKNFRVDKLDDLPEISARIGNLLRNQYVIGYTPSNERRDGKYRRVKLLLDRAEAALRVHYRTGYYAPIE